MNSIAAGGVALSSGFLGAFNFRPGRKGRCLLFAAIVARRQAKSDWHNKHRRQA
jgi:hypothetical protein